MVHRLIRNSRKCNAKINDNNTTGKYDIINGNLDLLGWEVSKSSMVMGDIYDESLAINIKDNWIRQVLAETC